MQEDKTVLREVLERSQGSGYITYTKGLMSGWNNSQNDYWEKKNKR
ncbi:hypothetical protein [Bacillus thuringiensis]|nr:hypothetical protein [Bacillus thuringiensis]MDY7965669.1 hypothetical protein [Bacillus thuringiensis]